MNTALILSKVSAKLSAELRARARESAPETDIKIPDQPRFGPAGCEPTAAGIFRENVRFRSPRVSAKLSAKGSERVGAGSDGFGLITLAESSQVAANQGLRRPGPTAGINP